MGAHNRELWAIVFDIKIFKRVIKKLFFALFLLTGIACGVPDEQYNSLKNENIALKAQIDTLTYQINDLKFGADALLRKAKLKIEDKDYEEAQVLLTKIVDSYYNSTEAFSAKNLLTEIAPLIEEGNFLSAKNAENATLLQGYIERYPDGRFVSNAKYLLEEKEWELAVSLNSKDGLENFIKKYPTSIYAPEVKAKLIKHEVDDVFNSGDYGRLPQLSKVYNPYQGTYDENSKITIENKTEYFLTILYSGTDFQKVEIASSSTQTTTLKSGSYRIVAFVDAPNISKYAGEQQINGEYVSSYYITSSPSSPYSTPSAGSMRFYQNSPNDYKWKSTNESPTYRHKSDYPVYKTRIGAICCDGTRSFATGRGACSHHGGVCQWLYK